MYGCLFFFFFFQAEDGIRDFHVTGVQTCSLPIYEIDDLARLGVQALAGLRLADIVDDDRALEASVLRELADGLLERTRSEERRVGKECRSRWSPHHYKKIEGNCI